MIDYRKRPAVPARSDHRRRDSRPMIGATVTFDIPGAWHYGQRGTVEAVRDDLITVRFPDAGTVNAPRTVVRPPS